MFVFCCLCHRQAKHPWWYIRSAISANHIKNLSIVFEAEGYSVMNVIAITKTEDERNVVFSPNNSDIARKKDIFFPSIPML